MWRTNLFFAATILSAFLLLSGCVALEKLGASRETISLESGVAQSGQDDQVLLQGSDELRKMVRKIIDYKNYIEDTAGGNLGREINEVATLELTEIGLQEQMHIILLSLNPKVSSSEIIILKPMLDSIQIDPQNQEQIKDLLGFLLEISRIQIMMRLQKDFLSEELDTSLKKTILIDQELMAERKKVENFQKQLQGLRDIEKIILDREKSDLPKH